MKSIKLSAVFLFLVVTATGPLSAAPLVNQIVPIAVYNGITSAFGAAHDPGNGVVWVKSRSGAISAIQAYNTYTAGQISSFPLVGGVRQISAAAGLTGQTTPNVFGGGGTQALGFSNGQIVQHRGGGAPIGSFDAITGANVNGNFFNTVPGGTSFLDGLDVDNAGNVFLSAEPAGTGRDSQKNAAIFLNNASLAQTDISAVSAGNRITRWSGIEVIDGLNLVFAVAEVDFNGGPVRRTIASYDLNGNFIAVDPDGSPFAARLEDLAFDGRFLYGTDFATNQVWVFDVVGPGGLEPVPEPASVAVWSMILLSVLGVFYLRRRVQCVVSS